MWKRISLVGIITAASSLAVLTLTSQAMAQSPAEAAHTPKMYPRAELINFGTYDKPPLSFEWPMIDVRQEPTRHRLQFVMTLDVDLNTAVDALTVAHEEQTPVATLAPGVLPFTNDRDLRVIGQSVSGHPASFTLRGKETTRRFAIKLTGEGSKTIVTIDNVMASQLFSGVVPPRVGFQPADANLVDLLYN